MVGPEGWIINLSRYNFIRVNFLLIYWRNSVLLMSLWNLIHTYNLIRILLLLFITIISLVPLYIEGPKGRSLALSGPGFLGGTKDLVLFKGSSNECSYWRICIETNNHFIVRFIRQNVGLFYFTWRIIAIY